MSLRVVKTDLNGEFQQTLKRLATDAGTTPEEIIRHSTAPARTVVDLIRKEKGLSPDTVVIVMV